MTPIQKVKQIILLIFGLSVAHLGVTFFIQANLGTDPFNVLVQGIFRSVPWPDALHWTHGRTHMMICFLIILTLLFIDKSYVRIGTIICMFLGGPIIDLFTAVLGNYINSSLSLTVRIFVLVAGCIILALGMTIVIKSEAGTGPNDLVAIVISDKTHKVFGIVRILTDCFFVAAGFLLGGTFGLGTIICAFLVGPVAQIFMPYSERFCKKILENH
ncbi:YczE/YyaS/YitT family protein [Blautia sp. XA-2221]|uniref:YczE/YyaS/YitT family protein n=1 Tax=Blautia sp. XA-2221 TaxID=2903961 RepID=UPI002378F563|nr:hypothetical protein [Blautia sp. XA-2221]